MSSLNPTDLVLALLGLGIVFVSLLGIAGVVAAMGKVTAMLVQQKSTKIAPERRDGQIDHLTVAIIAAAATVAVRGRCRIRKIIRTTNHSVWAEAGRLSVQGSHAVARHSTRSSK